MAQTAAQICALACQIAKVPAGLNGVGGYAAQAGVILNSTLSTLCQTQDFDFISKLLIINASAANAGYPLNADHLRTRQVFYQVNGDIFELNQISIEKYYSLFQGPGVDNYPYSFAVNVSARPYQILFYPPPVIPLSINVWYYPQMPDIVAPETSAVVPWFPNDEYLRYKVAADLMAITDDSRQEGFDAKARNLLSKFLQMDDDKEGFAQTLKLDRTQFRPSSSAKPNKAFPLG